VTQPIGLDLGDPTARAESPGHHELCATEFSVTGQTIAFLTDEAGGWARFVRIGRDICFAAEDGGPFAFREVFVASTDP
jgi:hypothetical protein